MTGWSSYSLSDFLMFSPEAYFRLYEINNTTLWPLQIIVVLAALAICFLSLKKDPQSDRVISIILAMFWALIAWQFFYQLFAKINLAAPWYSIGFAIESVALLMIFFTGRNRFSKTGFLLFLYALLIQPLIGVLSGRDWPGMEIFGIAPDPTALGTLGLLMMRTGMAAKILTLIPLAWCVVSGLTYLAMELPHGLITPVIALLFITVWLMEKTDKKVPEE